MRLLAATICLLPLPALTQTVLDSHFQPGADCYTSGTGGPITLEMFPISEHYTPEADLVLALQVTSLGRIFVATAACTVAAQADCTLADDKGRFTLTTAEDAGLTLTATTTLQYDRAGGEPGSFLTVEGARTNLERVAPETCSGG